jgi:S-methylmethionine-dependent homocysteine/selenocysteine methylase
MMVVVLDGPVGTELAARGVPTPAPAWSAAALDSAPDVVEQIHRDYAAAGAVVHTAATFRTTQRAVGSRWQELTLRAVEFARRGAGLPLPADVTGAASRPRVAGSIAPLEDCYRPDLSPADPRPEHRALARALAAAGVDLLLCETFPHVGEALIAVEEAVATGLPTWLALTAGPDASLMSVAELAEGAREATLRGAQAVLVNCVPAIHTLGYVERLAPIGVPFGAYANAGAPEHGLGWGASPDDAAAAYAELAAQWIDAGATLVGSCCGTGPAHIAALAQPSRRRSTQK